MSSIPADRGNERQQAARRDKGDSSAFRRRIECDGESGPARQAAPTRGGGLRDPDAWARRHEEGRHPR